MGYFHAGSDGQGVHDMQGAGCLESVGQIAIFFEKVHLGERIGAFLAGFWLYEKKIILKTL